MGSWSWVQSRGEFVVWFIADGRHSWMICEWSRTQRWKGGISYRSFSGYGVAGEWMDEGRISRCLIKGASGIQYRKQSMHVRYTQPNTIQHDPTRYLSSQSTKSSAIVLGG